MCLASSLDFGKAFSRVVHLNGRALGPRRCTFRLHQKRRISHPARVGSARAQRLQASSTKTAKMSVRASCTAGRPATKKDMLPVLSKCILLKLLSGRHQREKFLY